MFYHRSRATLIIQKLFRQLNEVQIISLPHYRCIGVSWNLNRVDVPQVPGILVLHPVQKRVTSFGAQKIGKQPGRVCFLRKKDHFSPTNKQDTTTGNFIILITSFYIRTNTGKLDCIC